MPEHIRQVVWRHGGVVDACPTCDGFPSALTQANRGSFLLSLLDKSDGHQTRLGRTGSGLCQTCTTTFRSGGPLWHMPLLRINGVGSVYRSSGSPKTGLGKHFEVDPRVGARLAVSAASITTRPDPAICSSSLIGSRHLAHLRDASSSVWQQRRGAPSPSAPRSSTRRIPWALSSARLACRVPASRARSILGPLQEIYHNPLNFAIDTISGLRYTAYVSSQMKATTTRKEQDDG